MDILATTLIDGLLLAGGAGRRMGGEDKGLLLYQGRPLAEHMSTLLRRHCQQIFISCQRHQSIYAQWGRCVSDRDATYAGPMAGVAALAAHSQAPWALLLPCDMPQLRDQVLLTLRQRALHSTAAVLAMRYAGQEQPLVSLWRHTALLAAAAAFDAGERGLRHYLLTRADWIDTGETGFDNINHPQQLTP